MLHNRRLSRAWRPVASSLAFLAVGLFSEPVRSQVAGVPLPPTAAARPPAAAPNRDPGLLGHWRDGELPELIWVSRGTKDCARVSGQGGSWFPRRIMDVQLPQRREIACNHVWQPTSDAAPDTAALRAAIPTVQPDSIVVNSLAGGPEQAALWSEPWYELARARFQMPEQHPAQPPRRLVRVAVLDSAALDGSKAGYSDPIAHGRAVMRVIEELACGQLSQCAAEIVPYPALPLLSGEDHGIRSAPLDAGAVGSRGLLAARIEQATLDWLQARATSEGAKRLVINLSLGWSGCWEPVNKDNAPELLASRLVHDAIERASCHGALVVAAGGNGDVIAGCPASAPGRPRHMFPGLWGGQTLTPERCAAVGVRDPAAEASHLLLGIGAVDRGDARLSTSDHEADLVAYAQNVVVPDATQASGYTLALAGTSMSAAAASGIAAALWAYDDALSPDKLVGALRNSAKDLRPVPAEPDFICNDPAGCARVRRIGLCSALNLVRPDLVCQAPELGAAPSMATPLAAAAQGVTFDDCSQCPGVSCPNACALPPDAGEHDAQDVPWIVPQPKPPACGTCVLVPGYAVFQAQFTQPVRDIRLVVQSSWYGQLIYKLGDAEMDPYEWYLPWDVYDAWSASLLYRPEGSVFHWESGDIPLSDWPVFGDAGAIAE